ncbi:winged helix-turn-helix transcriptional regulator [Streptomyces sp. G1]|uniref:winged helix-turn-helix transcriptional regulator n=1 Tax=Streptomyces sp. G1 TaxID=361572 RepID=UPI00202F30AC|nr:winged helix-turn-helix transcriptional regulator [Streptomyces sp. G1]MCM1967980.1 winged helix-turn-helix domain-containing protein [Streptomyces sp. G1]
MTSNGRLAEPVHRSVVRGHRAHFPGEHLVPDAERAEDALHRLSLNGTTAVLGALVEHGSMSYTAVLNSTDLSTGSVHVRLQRLQDDGLVHRCGPSRQASYTLTPAALDLGGVYRSLAEWSAGATTDTIVQDRDPLSAAQKVGAPRAAAAAQRAPSTASFSNLFSHAPGSGFGSAVAVTAPSRPSRAR